MTDTTATPPNGDQGPWAIPVQHQQPAAAPRAATSFPRKVWHLLVAIKDALALIFLLLFFVLLFGLLTARQSARSEEHTSELQSLMRISYAVFCLKKKNKKIRIQKT